MRYKIKTSEVIADTNDEKHLGNKVKVMFHEVIDLETNEIKLGTFDYCYASDKQKYLQDLEAGLIDRVELSPEAHGTIQSGNY